MTERDESAPERQMPTETRTDLEPDVERLHRAIMREPRDPDEGHEPAPWWVWTAAVLAIFWGGWYLGRHGGDFGLATHVAFARRDATVAAEASEKTGTAVADPVERGQQIYAQNCQSCHQQDGRGLAGVFPPIVGSEWVTGAPETLVRILLHGLQGPIEVAGQTYNGLMPAWAEPLTDQDIAAVSTYVRQWTPNAASAVSPELVSQLRAAHADRTVAWTAPELRAAEAAGPPAGAAAPDTGRAAAGAAAPAAGRTP